MPLQGLLGPALASTATVEVGQGGTMDHPWVRAALAGETEKLSRASEGDRNNQLNRSALALGSLPALELSDVVAQLLPTALGIGLEERESRATIRSGFEAGRKTPRSIPESERPISLIWSRESEEPAGKHGPEFISELIDWGHFWRQDFNTAEWVYPDVLARGRGHAIFASHKAGKSLLTLHMAAQMATSQDPLVVLYLDYEMTEADLFDRLDDMGYGPETDLSRLCYALLPTLPPLDSAEGAERLMELVRQVQARWPEHHLVMVIDTMSRAVAGSENEADTFRAFYNHTGIRLHGRDHLVVEDQVHQAVGREVADADRPNPAFSTELLHGPPGTVVVAEGLVDQVQIEVVELKPIERLLKRRLCLLVAGVISGGCRAARG